MVVILHRFSRKGLWVLSSAGSEHLPYKQRVGGSNPSAPTQEKSLIDIDLSQIYQRFFVVIAIKISYFCTLLSLVTNIITTS